MHTCVHSSVRTNCTDWASPVASLVLAASALLKELAQGTPISMLSSSMPVSSFQPGAKAAAASNDSNGNGTWGQQQQAAAAAAAGSSNNPGTQHDQQPSVVACTPMGSGAELCAAFVGSLSAMASITTPFTLHPQLGGSRTDQQGAPALQAPTNTAAAAAAAGGRAGGEGRAAGTAGTEAAAAAAAAEAKSLLTLSREDGHMAVLPLVPLVGSTAGTKSATLTLSGAPPTAAKSHAPGGAGGVGGAAAAAAAAIDGSLVSLLVAAQALIRKIDQQQQQSPGVNEGFRCVYVSFVHLCTCVVHNCVCAWVSQCWPYLAQGCNRMKPVLCPFNYCCPPSDIAGSSRSHEILVRKLTQILVKSN